MQGGFDLAGMHRSSSQRAVKKVNVPEVPDVPRLSPSSTLKRGQHLTGRHSSSSYGSLETEGSQHSTCSSQVKVRICQNGDIHEGVATIAVPTRRCGGTFMFPVDESSDPITGVHTLPSPRHRNSTGSNSSQASSGFESMKSSNNPYANTHLLALRSESPPSRSSYHSSGSSSLGSLERLDEVTGTAQINVPEMILNGVQDNEIITSWLQSLHYEEYIPLFVNAGYDLATIARMTPEDLNAIGITRPGHRKRITNEIHKLSIPCNLPCYEPAPTSQWLNYIGLDEYLPLFSSQCCNTIDDVIKLTWEDLDDIGIKKLGHLKKLCLAIKRLKETRQQGRQQSDATCHNRRNEVLTINVSNGSSQGCHKKSAEVRPYLHRNNNNPRYENVNIDRCPRKGGETPLLTFKQRKVAPQSSTDISGITKRYGSETHLSVHSVNAGDSNNDSDGGYDYISAPCSRPIASIAPQSNSFDTFPPAKGPVGDSANGLAKKPQVTVKPRPIAKVSAKSKPTHIAEMAAIDVNCSKLPLSEDFLKSQPNGKLKPEVHVPKRKTSYSSSGNSDREGSPPYDELPEITIMTKKQPKAGRMQCPLTASSSSEVLSDTTSAAVSSIPNCDSNYAISVNGHNFAKCDPKCPQKEQTPPKGKPPLPTPTPTLSTTSNGLFHLSSISSLDDSFDSDVGSLAGDFPPPPSPVRCEQSIHALRSIRATPGVSRCAIMTVNGVYSEGITRKIISCNSRCATVERSRSVERSTGSTQSLGSFTGDSNLSTSVTSSPQLKRALESARSVDSMSSSETLPFANENVGTIRQKLGESRRDASKLFDTEPSSCGNTIQSASSTDDQNNSTSGTVLNECFDMLQGLTDELDAMLLDTNNGSARSAATVAQ